MIRPARSHLQLFDRLFERCRSFSPIPMAVASPLTDVALAGALDAAKQGLIEPILVGSEREIRSLADRIEANLGTATIIDAANDEDAAQKSVALCRKGQARALMKGCVHTDTLMHAVLQHDSGLRTLRRVSHAFVLDTEAYPRPMMITDAAINIVPSLDDKVDIVKNSIDLAHTIGVERPNVAILSAIETVTSKMVSTIDAAALCKMADRGQITGAVLDGPWRSIPRSTRRPPASRTFAPLSRAWRISSSSRTSRPATCSSKSLNTWGVPSSRVSSSERAFRSC
jgi:phosphate acetyltransferase